MAGYGELIGGGLGLLSNIGFGLAGAYGSKPKVPTWKNIVPSQTQQQSILGNISNFQDISQLGELYTQNLLNEQNQLLPGYSQTLATGEKGAEQLLTTGEGLLSGQLPPDVVSNIERSDAYQSLMSGTAGSGMSKALTARDLGLTSLDLMQQGAQMIGQGGNSAQMWASLANQDIMNPASMFMTPQQTFQDTLENQIEKWNQQMMKANVAAAPDPMMSGMSNAFGTFAGQLAGSGIGGGGSNPNQFNASIGGQTGGDMGGILGMLMGMI